MVCVPDSSVTVVAVVVVAVVVVVGESPSPRTRTRAVGGGRCGVFRRVRWTLWVVVVVVMSTCALWWRIDRRLVVVRRYLGYRFVIEGMRTSFSSSRQPCRRAFFLSSSSEYGAGTPGRNGVWSYPLSAPEIRSVCLQTSAVRTSPLLVWVTKHAPREEAVTAQGVRATVVHVELP